MEDTSTLAEDWTAERLQSYITDQVAEDFRLDYKGADALPNSKMPDRIRVEKKEEIGRDVTAFANSDGGVIIYGISETTRDGRTVAGKFDPVSMSEMSAETLIQIIASHSEPTLVGVRIFRIEAPGFDDPSQVCFVVCVPKSDTAHMARDGRYYYRNESTRGMMRDWQVRDAMNRRKYPDVVLETEIYPGCLIKDRYMHTLQVRISNVGKFIARNYCAVVHFPLIINDKPLNVDEEGTEDHHVMALPDGKCFHWFFSNRNDDPLFPGRTVRRNAHFEFCDRIEYKSREMAELPSIEDVRITLYADEMPPKSYSVALKRGKAGFPLPPAY